MKSMGFDDNKFRNHTNNADCCYPFSSFYRNNQRIFTFLACFIFFGIVYCFYIPGITLLSPVMDSETQTDFFVNKTLPPVALLPESGDFSDVNESQASSPETYNSQGSQEDKCDIFTGEWVPDQNGPFYTNHSCNSIEAHQNCMKNGRPDSGYIYWRWTPKHCELPRFNPERFLQLMRNKVMAFIGDSISRNHVQSLLCTLSQVQEAVDVYHDEKYASRRWYFPSYNFTLSVIWSPFLIKAAIFENIDGVSSDIPKLNLDELDPEWIKDYKKFDYIEIGGGKWYLKTAIYYENNTVVGCHNCPQENITKLGFEYAYRKAINLALEFITSSEHKAYTIFRTSTPDHFENGEWNTGGYCNRTVPFKEGDIDLIDVDRTMHDIELEEFQKADKGLNLRLFDTTHLSLLRPDGHPGPYRTYQPFSIDKNAKVQLDCLHWCLPGPIDSWNDLMMETLMDE
ncbi:Protein trichome birefringence-like 25 [Heracleum sosnowskyi]|uniref:Protein trichome birefringence-like 25 n=1 Tax=Heracleum sosnowskyi TaxID=360622 RepID=A0AAD8I0C9_9APIA|nr:Protein trichome birefringence-like 25 [Heracleum sosnowskyi]